MDIVKIGITLFLFILTVDLPEILGRNLNRHRSIKNQQPTSNPVDFHLCGDHIMEAYKMICEPLWSRKWASPRHRRRHRQRRDVTAGVFVQTKHEAHDFLSSKRRKRDIDSGPTDLNEECCNESCRLEEVSEYC